MTHIDVTCQDFERLERKGNLFMTSSMKDGKDVRSSYLFVDTDSFGKKEFRHLTKGSSGENLLVLDPRSKMTLTTYPNGYLFLSELKTGKSTLGICILEPIKKKHLKGFEKKKGMPNTYLLRYKDFRKLFDGQRFIAYLYHTEKAGECPTLHILLSTGPNIFYRDFDDRFKQLWESEEADESEEPIGEITITESLKRCRLCLYEPKATFEVLIGVPASDELIRKELKEDDYQEA